MSIYKDSIETLRQTVEGLHASKARYKEKTFVRQVHDGDLLWEGDVFVFGLTYDSKYGGATKEQIANWRLPGPTAEALDAAERRGQKIRKQLETDHARNPEGKRKAKLAYAWSSPIKGSDKRKFNVVLHEGLVKSPADAVKAAMAKK
ncbi:MAG: hypothetical protein M1347_01575 [Chloroflexi bacterium]|nr:hypothetical protein [Chloroflexota bacterium]